MNYSKSFSLNKETLHPEVLCVHDHSDSFGTRFLTIRLETQLGTQLYMYLSQTETQWVDLTEEQIKETIISNILHNHNDDEHLRLTSVEEVKDYLWNN